MSPSERDERGEGLCVGNLTGALLEESERIVALGSRLALLVAVVAAVTLLACALVLVWSKDAYAGSTRNMRVRNARRARALEWDLLFFSLVTLIGMAVLTALPSSLERCASDRGCDMDALCSVQYRFGVVLCSLAMCGLYDFYVRRALAVRGGGVTVAAAAETPGEAVNSAAITPPPSAMMTRLWIKDWRMGRWARSLVILGIPLISAISAAYPEPSRYEETGCTTRYGSFREGVVLLVVNALPLAGLVTLFVANLSAFESRLGAGNTAILRRVRFEQLRAAVLTLPIVAAFATGAAIELYAASLQVMYPDRALDATKYSLICHGSTAMLSVRTLVILACFNFSVFRYGFPFHALLGLFGYELVIGGGGGAREEGRVDASTDRDLGSVNDSSRRGVAEGLSSHEDVQETLNDEMISDPNFTAPSTENDGDKDRQEGTTTSAFTATLTTTTTATTTRTRRPTPPRETSTTGGHAVVPNPPPSHEISSFPPSAHPTPALTVVRSSGWREVFTTGSSVPSTFLSTPHLGHPARNKDAVFYLYEVASGPTVGEEGRNSGTGDRAFQ